DYTDKVAEAMWRAGAGHIGQYSHCSFQTVGEGTFMASTDANPFVGKPNELHRESEVRLETIVKESNIKAVIQAMKKAHPYEEIAYDIIPLSIKGETFGLGRVAKLK